MKNKFGWSRYFAYFLIFLALTGCHSTKRRTEQRAKERVTQFVRFMSENKIEEAEELLSRELSQGETKEIFLESYDDQELKDSSIVITVDEIDFYRKDNKNKAVASLTVRNDKLDFTKMSSLPIKFERGDWYIGQ